MDKCKINLISNSSLGQQYFRFSLNLSLDTPKVKQRHQEATLRAELDQEQAVPLLPSSLIFRPRQGLKI